MIEIHIVPTKEASPTWLFHAMTMVQNGSRTMFTSANRNRMPMFGFYDHFKQRSSVLAVAMDGDRVVGTASLKYLHSESSCSLFRRTKLYWSWLLENCPTVVELGYVSIAPEYRGRGVARLLCQSLLDHSKAKTVYATVHIFNIPSIRLVRYLGFVPVGAAYVARTTGNAISAYRWDRT